MNQSNTPSHQGNGLSSGGPLSGKIGKLARGTTLAISMGLAGGLVQAKTQDTDSVGGILQNSIQQASIPPVSPMNNHNFDLPPGSRINKAPINGQVPLFYMLALKHGNIEGYQVDINQWEGLRLPGDNPETRKENVLKLFLESTIKNHPALSRAETIYITTANNPSFPKRINIENRQIKIEIDDSQVDIGLITISNASSINPQFTARMSEMSILENNQAAREFITILCAIGGFVIGGGIGVWGKTWYDDRKKNKIDDKKNILKPDDNTQKGTPPLPVVYKTPTFNKDEPPIDDEIDDPIVNSTKPITDNIAKLPEESDSVPEAPAPKASVPAPIPEALGTTPLAPAPEAPVTAHKNPTRPKAAVPSTKIPVPTTNKIEQEDLTELFTPEQQDSIKKIILILKDNDYRIEDITYELLDNDDIHLVYKKFQEKHYIKITVSGIIEKLDEHQSEMTSYTTMSIEHLIRYMRTNKHPRRSSILKSTAIA